MHPTEIKKGIYWVGSLDWELRDFHGYSTPRGTSYNAYLIKDEKIALFDTVKSHLMPDLLRHIKEVVNPEAIDYIIVDHVEMDHSGSLPEIIDIVKPEKVICSAAGKKALLAHFGREDWPYEVVKTGDTISLGKKTVRFIETKMLHWPDSMFSYIEEDKLLISQDAFGQHWATSCRFDDEVDLSELMKESATYYANILLLYSSLIQKLIVTIKEMNLEIDMIAPDHGLIWRSNPAGIIEAYDRWSRQKSVEKVVIAYDTMWHSTETMARVIADAIREAGVAVEVFNLAGSHRSDIITAALDARAIVMGSATLNNGMLPRMADLLCYMKGLRPLGKLGAAFGSYGWGGEAIKLISSAMEEMKFELIDPGLKVNYVPKATDIENCLELGKRIAETVKAKSE